MTDDIEYGPGVVAFIAQRPCVRQIAQKRIESGRGAGKQRYCLLEVMFFYDHPLRFADSLHSQTTPIVSIPKARIESLRPERTIARALPAPGIEKRLPAFLRLLRPHPPGCVLN